MSWILIAVLAAGASFALPMAVRELRKIRGPVVPGTATVLSLRQFGSVAANGPARMICRLRLRVETPGREPYETTVWQNIAPWDLSSMGVGSAVAVEVSETNPTKVRIGGGRAAAAVTRRAPVAAPVLSAADLLASGQRVPGVLRSFAPTGTTPRSLGRTPSDPRLIDAPHYTVEVELRFPNLTPVIARAIQLVPPAVVPRLAIGAPLDCAVDPADPAHRFAVDWSRL